MLDWQLGSHGSGEIRGKARCHCCHSNRERSPGNPDAKGPPRSAPVGTRLSQARRGKMSVGLIGKMSVGTIEKRALMSHASAAAAH